MRSGRAGAWAILLTLAPLVALGDAARDEALRAIRDQAGAIHKRVEAAKRPAWLDTNPHDSARAAGEALGRRQRERFRGGSADRLRLPGSGAALSVRDAAGNRCV
jgi:hypothetical protein